jgi:3-hydroxyacyl-CoA dehydrogenase/enoyl-CoA hydratase/3-hydroxybutyryl-CoA epimerase
MIQGLIDAGRLGRKSGAGFYEHPLPDRRKASWTEADRHLMERVRERLGGLLADEARRVHEEGVARSAEDIEMAMTLGTGYPVTRQLLAGVAG